MWNEVIEFANQHACTWARDPLAHDGGDWGMHLDDPPPHNRLLGPVFSRGPASGLVNVAGHTVCEFGEPDKADMTFSVTKTYLALVTGVAFDRGLLPELNEPVVKRIPGMGFDDAHNCEVTWEQLLQFTSEWTGECFGVPDSVDHHRHVGFQPALMTDTPAKGVPRALHRPGTFWEYNDVRINQFSLALLHVFGKPLPEILREAIMNPLGASNTWHWHGYDNSWIELNGQRMQSVPGGGHWGGGMQISARDQALVARMMLDRGRGGGRQLVSAEWIEQMLTPCPIAPWYGYFTWLNTQRAIRAASRESYFAFGLGGQTIWHDPTQDLVAVFRWVDATQLNGLIERVNLAVAGSVRQ